MDKSTLISLYSNYLGQEPDKVDELPSSGSNRRYFRLSGPKSLIGVLGTSLAENNAFIYMSEHFIKRNLPVPKVVYISDDRMAYLQEDLGDTLLFNAIEKGRLTRSFSSEERELLVKTIRLLPDLQFAGAVGLDFSVCYPASQFDTRSIMWDLNLRRINLRMISNTWLMY
jgi:hypothetical protein